MGYTQPILFTSAPPIDTPEYLTGVGQTIHKLFQTFDAGALWVMQAWSMREDIVKAVPKGIFTDIGLKRIENCC